ncbi:MULTISPECIES: YbaB/EbfC family nucleoid-associated protein [unclassified Amycolatopsis]|uniref:YbaB/EbfC family nucleoid-associated protein n=1 Tax=unclassified Amycolatopsis TaxID=2618356 RepID=UPI002E21289B|nr:MULTISPECIES: YbaB/EbfC family nucleoid-associated protein [unclassified Amycolatopsis]
MSESPDGTVRATLGERGELVRLWLDPRLLREPDRLAARVLDTVAADAEFDFEPLLRELDGFPALRDSLERFRDELPGVRETAFSDDGLISATVTGDGRLADLEVSPRACHDSKALATVIVATVRRAGKAVEHRNSTLAHGLTAPAGTPRGARCG